ncbi:MAG TPA: hypothetical protein VGP47_04410 [Parachlamydiaceae bacterium]|nr:hypothetical protein [Parachlamydiaceae bacterium]
MNITTSPIASSTISPKSPCCSVTAKPSLLQANLDTICRIALGVFAALYAPVTFAVTFGIGMISGSAYAITRISQNKPMYPDGESKPVCAQGYMDFLSGMRFPPAIGTLATAAFIAAHTRHDPQFYAPFCGLFIGFWLGRQSILLQRS